MLQIVLFQKALIRNNVLILQNKEDQASEKAHDVRKNELMKLFWPKKCVTQCVNSIQKFAKAIPRMSHYHKHL